MNDKVAYNSFNNSIELDVPGFDEHSLLISYNPGNTIISIINKIASVRSISESIILKQLIQNFDEYLSVVPKNYSVENGILTIRLEFTKYKIMDVPLEASETINKNK